MTLDNAAAILAATLTDGSPYLSINPRHGVCNTKASHWARALQLFHGLEGLKLQPDLISCNTAIHACARGEAWQAALQLLNSQEADVISFSACISVLGKAGRWQQAMLVLRTMSVRPNSVTYLNTITACERAARWQQALALLPDEDGEACCNAALAACPWHQGVQLLGSMRSVRTDLSCISSRALISSCAQGMQWGHALHTMRSLHLHRVSPDVSACSAAISACETCAATQQGVHLLREMHGARLGDGVPALRALARLGQEDVTLCRGALRAAQRQLPSLRAHELAQLAWSAATLGIASVGFWQQLSKHAVMQMRRCNIEELRHLIWAFASARMANDPLPQISAEVLRRSLVR
ncbi:unnamed protein product, partial [Effrenium voratum]